MHFELKIIKMLTIQCKMQEDHTSACAQDTYPLTAEEAKVKSLSVSVLKLFPHSSKTCKTKTIIKHFLMRKALVPLTDGYCQSTVACKTRLSCLDFASWLSHQLHHRQPLMKKSYWKPWKEAQVQRYTSSSWWTEIQHINYSYTVH